MFRSLLLLLLVCGSLLLGGFLYIDHKVSARLNSTESPNIPAILSEPLGLSAQTRLSLQQIRQELLDRGYRESSSKPQHQGEFYQNNTDLEIFSRDFRAADGSSIKAQNVSLNLANKTLNDADNPARKTLLLEPRVISYLGSIEKRASRFRKLRDIPPILSKAVIAIEDERFATHHGLDLVGIARAMFRNIQAMRIVEGGSTLTQQLAKNLLFSPERTIFRKIMEAFAALSLENRLSKQNILEMYLNEVYLGQEGSVAIHGVAEAARSFFGKDLGTITLRESAILAGIIKAPSSLSPRKHYKRALERSVLVLDKLLELGLITKAQYLEALQEKPAIVKKLLHERNAAHFVLAVSQLIGEQINLAAASLAGISVHTGLDLRMQDCAEEALQAGLAQTEKQHPKLARQKRSLEGGLLAIEPHSGKIRAWVGSRSYAKNQFDHVSQANRQVGSTIKAFLYLTALDGKLNNYKVANPITILSDEPMQVDLVTRNSWIPENYDHRYRGDVTLRYALENSLNIPAAYVGQRVGIENLSNTLKKFRVSADPPNVPALALGALDTKLLDLTAGYGALANQGIYTAPRLFISALDGDGNTLLRSQIFEERVADENAVFVLNNILQGVIERGTARIIRSLGFQGEAAGKTGTSNETRDAWFIGFTPTLVAGVWVGFDDNSKTGLSGGVAAAPIWAEFMKCAAPYYEEASFITPPGVVYVDIDANSGELATTACPPDSVVNEVFVRGTEPATSCRVHSQYAEDIAPQQDSQEDVQNAEHFPREKEKRRERRIWEILFGE